MEKAQQKVKQAKNAMAAANSKVDSWKRSVSGYRERLKKRNEEIENKRKNANKDCKNECGRSKLALIKWEIVVYTTLTASQPTLLLGVSFFTGLSLCSSPFFILRGKEAASFSRRIENRLEHRLLQAYKYLSPQLHLFCKLRNHLQIPTSP